MSELKIQDGEEITLKKLKASGGDKEGLKEAEIRSKLASKLSKYYKNIYTLQGEHRNQRIFIGLRLQEKCHNINTFFQ